MSQSYTKGCRDCGQQIRMDQVNGKWAAYELNGNGFHSCKGQGPAIAAKQGPNGNGNGNGEDIKRTVKRLDERLKRMERAFDAFLMAFGAEESLIR